MGFLNIYRNPQTYRNLGYLFLSFPLGIGYFVALTFAISLGGSLVALCGVGLLILAVLPLGVLPVMEFERKLANEMLGTDIAPQHIPATDNLIDQLRVMWFNGSAIRGIIYMFARFPFGIVAFILAVMAVSLPFGLIIAPLTYQSSNIVIGGNTVDTLPEAIIAAVIGLILSPFFMMGVNALAGFWKLFATALLHGKRTVEIDMEKAKRETFDYEKLKRDDGIHLAEPVSKAKNDDPSRRSISDLVHRTMEAQSQDDDQAAQQ